MVKKVIEPVEEQQGALERTVTVWPSEAERHQGDWVAQEVAVALVYNGVSHAVMMASPKELEAFALGFSLTEGIINRAEELYTIEVILQEKGIEVALTISSQCFMHLKNRRRNLTGRSGCGICGAESLEQVLSPLDVINAPFNLSHHAINRATSKLSSHQPLQALTGAVHGAAWCDSKGNIVRVCEDVGRHNALDKLIGSLCSSKGSSQSILQQPGFLLMSSRASYEIVQKAAKVGVAVVTAVSAPTSLAIDIAEETGITLIGFSRQDRHVAYTHGHRLIDTQVT